MLSPLRSLFVYQAMFSVIYCFGNVFLNVFLWEHGQTFEGIGIFNLFSVFSIFLFSLIGGYLLKQWGTRSTFIVSSLLGFLTFLFLSELPNHSLIMLPLVGTLYGGYVGLFYVGFNLMLIWLAQDAKRNYYIGLESAVATAAQLLTPIISGMLIVAYGYRPLFLAIVAIMIGQMVIVSRIPHLRTTEKYRRRSFFVPENRMMTWVGLSSTAYGFYFSFIQMSYGLFIYFFIQDEFRLGSWNFFFSLISATMYWIVGKQLNQSNKDLLLGLGMIASLVVTLGLLLSEPFWFILFNLTVSVSLPLLWIPAKAIHFAYIKKHAGRKPAVYLEKMVQFLIYREFSISMGRMLFFFITIIGFELGAGVSYYIMVLLAVSMPIGIWLLNRKHAIGG